MNAAVGIKKELHDLIDVMSIEKLKALKPLLHMLNEVIVETNLSPDEVKIIQKGRKELKEHPENFVLFE